MKSKACVAYCGFRLAEFLCCATDRHLPYHVIDKLAIISSQQRSRHGWDSSARVRTFRGKSIEMESSKDACIHSSFDRIAGATEWRGGLQLLLLTPVPVPKKCFPTKQRPTYQENALISRERSCRRKLRHLNYLEALRHAARVPQNETVVIYPCAYCTSRTAVWTRTHGGEAGVSGNRCPYADQPLFCHSLPRPLPGNTHLITIQPLRRSKHESCYPNHHRCPS